jgi:FPC/CPF motif-containing protein YcgG
VAEQRRFVVPTWVSDSVPPTVKEFVERQLRALVLDTPFPCAGARAAVRNAGYLFNLYADMGSRGSLAELVADLRYFAQVRSELGNFYSFVASFVEPARIDEEQAWDVFVWSFLQKLHDFDDAPWDDRFSTDPQDAGFALSFAGCGQLVVSLYPGATRYSRRFAWPTLVFNPLEQDRANFPDDESFERFRDTIRARDVRLQGSVNPSLPLTLDDPQAPGFSGAPVGPDWTCPIRLRPGWVDDHNDSEESP